MRRFVHFISILSVLSACRSTNSSQILTKTDTTEPLIFSLTENTSDTPIDSMPFQFWLQSRPKQILATNRAKGALNYTSQNKQINIPVSNAAKRCMGHVFSTIAESDIKNSAQWLKYKKKYPYRFLELLPEVKDFYSQSINPEELYFSQLTMPVLWNGFEATGTSKPTDAGFKVRGYLKWSGVLLPDGKTCLVAKRAQILQLLDLSIKCEDGDQSSCYFPTETVP